MIFFDEAWIKLKRSSIAQLPLEIAVIRATHSAQASTPVAAEKLVAAPVARPAAEQSGRPAVVPTPTREQVASKPAPSPVATQEKRQEGLGQAVDIKKKMSEVYKAVQNPGVRMSFQSAQITAQKGNDLFFSFPSQFHFDKVNAPEAFVMIEAALEKVLGQIMKIHIEVKKPDAASNTKLPAPNGNVNGNAPESPVSPPASAPVSAEKTADVLEWETVEEPVA